VLVQPLGDALGFERALAQVQRLEHVERRPDEPVAAEDAADPGEPLGRVDDDERVDDVVGAEVLGPAARRSGAAQAGDVDTVDQHGLVP
jgi:hypothetical protein